MSKLTASLMKPVFIKEHGTWAMVYVPLISGFATSRIFDFSGFLFLLAVSFAYFSYRPAEIILQEKIRQRNNRDKIYHAGVWGVIYISLAAGLGIPVLIIKARTMILAAASIALIFFLAAEIISIKFKSAYLRDLLSISGLTLLAPIAYYFSTGVTDRVAVEVWAYNLFFFLSSAVYIHMKLAASGSDGITSEEFNRRRFINLFFQAGLILILTLLVISTGLSTNIGAGFAPMLIHTIAGSFYNRGKTNFKKIGLIFLCYSILFLFFISI